MSSSEDEDELPQDLRPSPESIQKSFEELFKNPLLSLPYLKEQAIRGQIKSLKSLHWRVSNLYLALSLMSQEKQYSDDWLFTFFFELYSFSFLYYLFKLRIIH